MTVLMSGINMYSMALVMKVVLGWDIQLQHLGLLHHRHGVCGRLADCSPPSSMKCCSSCLIWLGALLIPILGLVEAGGWTGLEERIAHNLGGASYTHLWQTLGSFQRQPDGYPLDGYRTSVSAGSSRSATGRPTSSSCSASSPRRILRSAKMAPIIGAGVQDDRATHCHPSRLAGPGFASDEAGRREGQAMATGDHSYNEVLPLMLARYCGPGLLGLGVTALIAGFMSGMAGNVSAFRDRLDIRHL